MEIYHTRTHNTIRDVRWCASFWQLGIGLLFRKRGRALLVLPSPRSGWQATIMTYGMRFALDVVCMDTDGVVREIGTDIPPGNRYVPETYISYVLEGEAGLTQTCDIQVGDTLSWEAPR